MSSSLISLGVAIAGVFLFWTMSSTSSSPFARNFPRLYNQRICLLIAHPDDEAMFFAPTVLALTKPELGNHLKILCLSTGDADGLGHIRKKELQQSALQLGLRNESDVYVVDDPARFPDSMSTIWSESDVSDLLASAFAPDLLTGSVPSSVGNTTTAAAARKRDAKSKHAKTDSSSPSATIDVILTFDQRGISNHPNHRSLYHGALYFLRTLMKDKPGYSCPVSLYTLHTTSLLRKYIGVLDAPITMARGAVSALVSSLSRSGPGSGSGSGSRDGGDKPSRLLFVSSVGEWMTAQSAMVKAHKSQMVWFRWGWITFGRYMAVNDLQREKA